MRKSFFALLLFISTLCFAQGSMPLTEVRLVGSERYTREEVLKAVGLTIGKSITPDEMAEAADRLSNTGAFRRVTYQYQYGPQGYAMSFRVEDPDGFYPVRFVNFFWFSEEELTRTLLASVPLFKGVMANTAPMADSAVDVLQALVDEKGIPGKVVAVPEAKAPGAEMHVWKFKLTGLKIRINSVAFPGAPAEIDATLQSSVRPMLMENYDEGLADAYVQGTFLPALHNYGLLRARFGEPQVKLASPNPSAPTVTVMLPVQLGPQFRIASLSLQGNTVIPTAELEKHFLIKPGEVANGGKILAIESRIRSAFGTKGFLKAEVKAEPTLDMAARTAAYTFKIEEGEQYRMGKLSFMGLDAKGVEKLTKLWKLNAGEIYNTEYINEFGGRVMAMLPQDVELKTALNVDHQTRIVNVVYRFVK